MIDFVLGLYLAALVARGWLRGFVRELMDLVGLVLGLVVAFRLSEPLGEFVSSWSGMGPGASRVTAGIVLFILVGLLAAVGAHYLAKIFKRPGLEMSNRALGAGLAVTWAWALATVIVSVLVILPMPLAVADQLERSALVRMLTDPELPTQQAFHAVAGNRVVENILSIQRLVGNRQIILEEGESLPLEPADPSELAREPADADEVFDLLNEARVDAGLPPLAWSEALAEVGYGHATEMYVEGYFAHESPTTGTVADRIRAQGVTVRLAGENLALAAAPFLVHEGLMGSEGHRANILRPEFRRVGIGAVQGPHGLMVVQVFSG